MTSYTIDSRSRQTRVVIGGIDYSEQFEEFIGSDDHLSTAGLVMFRGSITISKGPISIDNWDRSLDLGTLITIDVFYDGQFRRHPRGALRIIGSEYNEETGSLVIEVGCKLAARSFQETPSVFVPGVQPGTLKSLASVVAALLTYAGFDQISYNSANNFSFRDRPDLDGSAVEIAGSMLASAGLFAWCDKDEIIQIDEVQLGLGSVIFDGYAYQLKSFQKVKLGQPPTEELLVTGEYRVVHERADSKSSVETEYAPRIVDLNTASGDTVTVPAGRKLERRTRRSESIDFSQSTQTFEEETDLSTGTVYRGWEGFPSYGMVSGAESKTKKRSFERNSEAKLLRITETEQKHLSIVMGPYLDWLLENDEDGFAAARKTGRMIASETQETFEYDSRSRVVRHTVTKKEPMVTVLAALGDPAWGEISLVTNLSSMVETSRTVTTYSENAPEDWDRKASNYLARAMSSSARVGPITLIEAEQYSRAAIVAKGLVLEGTDEENSNSGQTNPPQAERMPARFKSESRSIETLITFPTNASDWKPRRRSLQIPYLPDRISETSPPLDVLAAYGKVWGGLEQSQWKSARIEIGNDFWFFDGYRPFAQISVHRFNRTYRLAVNGTSWLVTREEMGASTDAALLGEQIGASVDSGGNTLDPGVLQPPYTVTGTGQTLRLKFDASSRDFPSPMFGDGYSTAADWLLMTGSGKVRSDLDLINMLAEASHNPKIKAPLSSANMSFFASDSPLKLTVNLSEVSSAGETILLDQNNFGILGNGFPTFFTFTVNNQSSVAFDKVGTAGSTERFNWGAGSGGADVNSSNNPRFYYKPQTGTRTIRVTSLDGVIPQLYLLDSASTLIHTGVPPSTDPAIKQIVFTATDQIYTIVVGSDNIGDVGEFRFSNTGAATYKITETIQDGVTFNWIDFVSDDMIFRAIGSGSKSFDIQGGVFGITDTTPNYTVNL